MAMRALMSRLGAVHGRCTRASKRAHHISVGPQRRCAAGEVLESRVHLSAAPYVAAPPVATLKGPWCVKVADLNNDGNQDMVIVDQVASSVEVILGKSDHTFQSAQVYAIRTPARNEQNAQPRSVAIADVNGDGKLDLVVSNFAGHALSILNGHGDGTFAAASLYAAPVPNVPWAVVTPYAVVTGRFESRGAGDALAPDFVAVTNLGLGTVTVFSTDGAVFTTDHPAQTRQYKVGSSPGSITTGDFNGDGVTDLATANFGDRTASVLYGMKSAAGNATGLFETQKKFSAGAFPEAVVAADFNKDGNTDLAVTGGNTKVNVLISQGASKTFVKAVKYDSGHGALGLAVGDLNGDGNDDLAVTNYFSNSVSVLPGNGDGTFGRKSNLKVPVKRPRSIAIGDFNKDGKPDLAVVGSTSSQYTILWANTAPSAINLSQTTVPPTAARAVVAGLTADDPTPDDRLKFALVRGTGSQDNGSFAVQQTADGWVLKARKPLTSAKGVYHILLRVTDAAGESFTQAFEITVTQS